MMHDCPAFHRHPAWRFVPVVVARNRRPVAEAGA
jgi:hypothetical protein